MTKGHAAAGPLDGEWTVHREAGLLPPLAAVHTHIAGTRGTTRVGAIRLPFRVVDGPDGLRLGYTGPLAFVRDRLRHRGGVTWGGDTFIAGIRVGRFRMVRVDGDGTHGASGCDTALPPH